MNLPLVQNSQQIAHLLPEAQLAHIEHHLNQTTANFQGVGMHAIDPQVNHAINDHIAQAQDHYNNALQGDAQSHEAFNNHIQHALLHLNHATTLIHEHHAPGVAAVNQAFHHEANNAPPGPWEHALDQELDDLLDDADNAPAHGGGVAAVNQEINDLNIPPGPGWGMDALDQELDDLLNQPDQPAVPTFPQSSSSATDSKKGA